MDRDQFKKAWDKIDGHFMPSPTKPGGVAAEFARAKEACLREMCAEVDRVESITLEAFLGKNQAPAQPATTKAAEPYASAQYRFHEGYFKTGAKGYVFRWVDSEWVRTTVTLKQLKHSGELLQKVKVDG